MKLRLIDRLRFTDEEWERAGQGLCTEVIEYGMSPFPKFCPKPLDPDSCYAACTQHDREWVEEYDGEKQYRRDRETATEVEL